MRHKNLHAGTFFCKGFMIPSKFFVRQDALILYVVQYPNCKVGLQKYFMVLIFWRHGYVLRQAVFS